MTPTFQGIKWYLSFNQIQIVILADQILIFETDAYISHENAINKIPGLLILPSIKNSLLTFRIKFSDKSTMHTTKRI